MSVTNSTTIRSINNTSDDRVRLEGPIVELPTGTVNLTSADSGVIYTLKPNSSYEVNLPLESVEIGTKITLINNEDFGLGNVNLVIHSDVESEIVAINLMNINGTDVNFTEAGSGLANSGGQIPHFFKTELIYVGNNVWKGTSIGSDVCLEEN
tara:strand:- start:1888 stop:2346 length:459 start_codon:yes stop_codon:yes gene_type:complete